MPRERGGWTMGNNIKCKIRETISPSGTRARRGLRNRQNKHRNKNNKRRVERHVLVDRRRVEGEETARESHDIRSKGVYDGESVVVKKELPEGTKKEINKKIIILNVYATTTA